MSESMSDFMWSRELVDIGLKTALITGGAQGFGFAIARRFADAGARVHLLDVNADQLETARQRLASLHCRVAIHHADVTSEADVERVVAEIIERDRFIDILVNNAGVFSNVLIVNMPVEEMLRILRVNVSGTFVCTKMVAAAMIREGRRGSIVNITSIAAIGTAVPGNAFYAATKAEAQILTLRFALELGAAGITVNAEAPGFVQTERTRGSDEDSGKAQAPKMGGVAMLGLSPPTAG